ncbi:dna repair exonuclease [Stylonychia lemnae]|uniref:Double-strand break repair protein n=1 Tax=Stylonychia lemnae TaxID=5949 RepID=A0A078AEK1_STYLE|nr:dna repair exonuclease [Stylonychia lemnae]|eukprot:CDW79338.1 dna repair exonuclease [Stylonychia lemnae]
MISTDNHLGYKENDRVRSNDSFLAFQEVLATANGTPNLDYLLLGGDLFHDHKPSRKTFFKLQQMMNQYVFGEQNIQFQTYQYKEANYNNENLSVKLPIFIIHGNHDDPSGLEYLSNIDLMNSNNYVNYFGKVTNIEDIEVVPILFVKGQTKLALYGIGNMKDERLNIAFENKKIKFKRPLNNKDDWFNILVLHQNKYKGMHLGMNRRNSLTEGMIPKFIHLVIWAHEHESIPTLTECHENGVHFLQPGSTVATSLIQAESKDKHCFYLQVYKTSFKVQALRLQNIRPFIFENIELSRVQPTLDPRNNAQIEDYLIKKIESMLAKVDATNKIDELKLPLIRLKIEHSGFPVFRSKKLNDYFTQRIANNQDFLHFHKKLDKLSSYQNGYNNGDGASKSMTGGTQDVNLMVSGPGLPGIDDDENQSLLQSIFKRKMAGEIERYVNSGDAHRLELFFDNEVFKRSYKDLNSAFQEMFNQDQDEVIDTRDTFQQNDMEQIEQQRHTYQSLKRSNYDQRQNKTSVGGNGQSETASASKAANASVPGNMFQIGRYTSTLGNQSVIRQIISQKNEQAKEQYLQEKQDFDSIFGDTNINPNLNSAAVASDSNNNQRNTSGKQIKEYDMDDDLDIRIDDKKF